MYNLKFSSWFWESCFWWCSQNWILLPRNIAGWNSFEKSYKFITFFGIGGKGLVCGLAADPHVLRQNFWQLVLWKKWFFRHLFRTLSESVWAGAVKIDCYMSTGESWKTVFGLNRKFSAVRLKNVFAYPV